MQINFYKKCFGYVGILALLFVALMFSATEAFAAQSLADIAKNITKTFDNVAKLITAIAYIAGLGFSVGAIFKFKAHKDNPTQIPVGTPLAMLFVGAALIFSPNIFKMAGETVFDGTGSAGGATGVDPFTN